MRYPKRAIVKIANYEHLTGRELTHLAQKEPNPDCFSLASFLASFPEHDPELVEAYFSHYQLYSLVTRHWEEPFLIQSEIEAFLIPPQDDALMEELKEVLNALVHAVKTNSIDKDSLDRAYDSVLERYK